MLAALYSVTGVALMGLFVWQQLDPEGPVETFAKVRARIAHWRQTHVALLEQLDEIRALPETERETPCEDS